MFLSLKVGTLDKLASTAPEQRSAHKNDTPIRGSLRLMATQKSIEKQQKMELAWT